MKKILSFLFLKLFALVIDIFETFTSLTLCERLAIIKLVGFGLLISGIYGFYNKANLGDLILIIGTLYGAIKSNRKIKEIEC